MNDSVFLINSARGHSQLVNKLVAVRFVASHRNYHFKYNQTIRLQTTVMDEDVTLPRATLIKMIKENMPSDMRVSSDLIDLMIECCTEFVHMIYSQANEVCVAEKKSTIAPDHVLEALKQLDLAEWMDQVQQTLNEFKDTVKQSSTKDKAGSAPDMSEEELLAMQQKLFADAWARSYSSSLPESSQPGNMEGTAKE